MYIGSLDYNYKIKQEHAVQGNRHILFSVEYHLSVRCRRIKKLPLYRSRTVPWAAFLPPSSGSKRMAVLEKAKETWLSTG